MPYFTGDTPPLLKYIRFEQMIILASTSKYRKSLLNRLGIPFEAMAPLCDEDQFKKLIRDPQELAVTLAREKARSLAGAHSPDTIVIGGDQVATFENEILGKPHTAEKAFAQLKKLQGKTHRLVTAVCVVQGSREFPILDITELEMRPLTDSEIQNYIEWDQPLDCAASYKIEKSGITLMKRIQCADFTAIEGLPLIQLTKVLKDLGVELLSDK